MTYKPWSTVGTRVHCNASETLGTADGVDSFSLKA